VNIEKTDREHIINEHRYLCVRGARKFIRDGIDRRDLEQVAAIGLIKATDRFDPSVGTPFEAYAWTFVLGELMHYVRDTERAMRAPRKVREMERRFADGERILSTALGRSPEPDELCAYVDATPEDLREVMRFRQARVPLSVESLRPFEEAELAYTIDGQLDSVTIEGLLAELNATERKIVREIYMNDVPVALIAERLGYSRRHVTRLHRNALRKLGALGRPISA
jgi:RNA polymerase sigma-B factor